MKIHDLLHDLYFVVEGSPLSIPMTISDGSKMYFGLPLEADIVKLIREGREIKRWALYNDHSELVIDLEVNQ